PYRQEAPNHSGPPATWSRASSPSAQVGPNHLSFTRHGAQQGHRSPPPYPSRSRPSPTEISTQRPYTARLGMPPSPMGPSTTAHSPEEYQNKRHHAESDSEGYSDMDKANRDREAYYGGSYYYYHGKPQDHPEAYKRDQHHHPVAPSSSSMYGTPTHPEGLPALAPRPLRYSMEEEQGQDSRNQHPPPQHHSQPHSQNHGHSQNYQRHQYPQHQQQQQYPITSTSPVKKESDSSASAPFRIHSARGTPKGPLPIEVQISLLTSVLKHDPFNCPIRKTTQAWECISREQHIRARTCSRRFDNIIQASIAGRDRPVGTEEQQATKKKLLEQLFEMMNQPQALKRMQKKRRYRSEDTDRRLLLETIRLNPFAQKVGQVAKAWEDVRDALKMKVHARQCIRRVNRMVKPYQLRERMYKGNIPDEMKEANDDLVKQVIQLMRMAGQGGSLDEGCNTNDEDSASGISDSDDQEDSYMESRGQENAQEDDELEEDEDEDMMSRSESEQRNNQRRREDDASGAAVGTLTPRSPVAPVQPSPSTQSTTPSFSASALGPSSTPATPAKRGRPRNPMQPSSQTIRHSSHGSVDRTRIHLQPIYNSTEGSHDPSVARQRIWEGEGSDQKPARLLTNGGTDDRIVTNEAGYGGHGQGHGHGQGLQSTPLSSPLSVHSPNRVPTCQPDPASIGSGHARHFSRNGDSLEMSDYKRPMKHARTNSRGVVHETHVDLIGRSDRARPTDPVSRLVGGSNMSTARSPVHVDVNGRPLLPNQSNEMAPDSSMPTPTAQQYREVLNELDIMRDYLAQMDEHRRVEKEKQGSLIYMVEKLQHQMQQQQQQLSQLQHQLRSGYPPQSQQQQQPPQQQPHASLSPHQHPHHQQSQPHQQGPPLPPSAAPSGGPARYPPHPSEHHASFHKNEGHSPYMRPEGQGHYAPRDRELR
ncbi:hypothetical protein BGX28_004447, partial [Mortierella sp. GBA30]